MEENSQINLKENNEAANYLSNSKKLKKRNKIKKIKTKNLFTKATSLISNKFIKQEISNNNNNDVNKQIKKERNPGIDLVRLITQYCIVLVHFMAQGGVFKHFYKHERILRLIYSFIDWHNNAFLLISGIVGYKTNKYTNLFYLWLMVVFYSVGIHKYITTYRKDFYVNQDVNKLHFPLVFDLYWYYTQYFGMFLFLPVINKGIAQLSRYEFTLVVMSTLGILVLWKDYKNKKQDIFHIAIGNTVIWFLIYYLTGAYIGKYRVDYKGFKRYACCLICGAIFTIASYLYFKLSIGEYYFLIGNKRIEIPIIFVQMYSGALNSVLKIVQAITVCLFFLQIHYNKYIAKIICFFGPLAFSVYLIHSNRLSLENYMPRFFINQPRNISLESLLSFMFLKSFKIFAFCLFIDYLRNLLFYFLRIKNILLFIEAKIKEKFY